LFRQGTGAHANIARMSVPEALRPTRAWRRLLLLVFALALGAGGCATLDEQQRRWIFQPSDRAWGGSAAAAQGLQDVWIEFDSRETGERARLHGLWLPGAQPDAPVLLYLHGARWDVRGSAWRMRRMAELGFAVLGVDYRGFGQSSPGLPSEATAYEDAQAAWRWLGERQPGARRYLFGHSLGGAIAVHLASEADDVAGLMVEGSFTSIPEVFRSLKWGWLPVEPLITQRFDAATRIARARAPVLVVHGSEDRLIPPQLGRALYERAPEPKRFVLVEGGTHHNTNGVGHELYRSAVAELFGVVAGGRAGAGPRAPQRLDAAPAAAR
jgi:pimeloyl-ACP methyl ester carboxylesterase